MVALLPFHDADEPFLDFYFFPLIIFLSMTIKIFRTFYIDFCCIKSDFILINLLLLPVNISIILLNIAFGLVLGAVLTPYWTIECLVENYWQFTKIMSYWSRKNRFKGDGKVKEELFKE